MTDRTPARQSAAHLAGSGPGGEHAASSGQAGGQPAGAHLAAARGLLVQALRTGADTEVLLHLVDALTALDPLATTHPAPAAGTPPAAVVGEEAALDRVLLHARVELASAAQHIQPPAAAATLRRASGHIAHAGQLHGRSR